MASPGVDAEMGAGRKERKDKPRATVLCSICTVGVATTYDERKQLHVCQACLHREEQHGQDAQRQAV